MEQPRPTTPEARYIELMGYFKLDQRERIDRAIEKVALLERETGFFNVAVPSENASLAEQVAFTRWGYQLGAKCDDLLTEEVKSHLDDAFVSDPCKEYIVNNFKSFTVNGKKSQALMYLEEIETIPKYRGGLFDINKAGEIEQGLHYIATQDSLDHLKLASSLHMVNTLQEYGITAPNSDLLSRWRAALVENKGGFA